MGAAALRGTCEACGRKYGVPEAGRSYRCKNCGGTVRVLRQALVEELPVEEMAREGRPREPRRERAAGRQRGARRSKSNARTGWVVLGVLLVLIGVGYGLVAKGVIGGVFERETDLGAVTGVVIEEWQGARIGALVDWHHPDGRDALRTRLEAVATKRGWTAGFPKVRRHAASVSQGTAEAPEKGVTALEYEGGKAILSWMFDAGRGRWFMTGLDLTPPSVGRRVDGFRAAWARSDGVQLLPFFRKETGARMLELIDGQATKAGWTGGWPALGEPAVEGEEQARSPMAKQLGLDKVEALYPTDEGELLVRWRFIESEDDWFVSGFRFP